MSLMTPINTNICQGSGTIFSTPSSGSEGDGGQAYTFTNLGLDGTRVYAQIINNNVQFRRLIEGANISITEQSNSIKLDVNDLAFDSTLPIKRNVIGLQGITLNKQGILATLKELLYPTIQPTLSISISPAIFELGNTANLAANWSVIKTDETILSISVNNTPISPISGNSQSGIYSVPNLGNVSIVIPMNVSTSSGSYNQQTTAKASRKLRIGPNTKDGIVSSLLDSDINNLSGYFSDSYKIGPMQVVIPTNNYLVICIPNILLGANTPTFKINGFINNAFQRVRNNAFVNTFGFSDTTSVYVSNVFSTGTIQFEIA